MASRSEMTLACYGILPAFQLILPSPLMRNMVRLAHGLEVTSSMLVFGAAIALLFSKPEDSSQANSEPGASGEALGHAAS